MDVLRSAVTVCLLRTGRVVAACALVGCVLIASAILAAALLTVSLSVAALVLARVVLPIADVLEAQDV